MTSKGIFRLSLLAFLLGRSLKSQAILHSSFLDHPPQVCSSPSDRSIKKPVNEKNCEWTSGRMRNSHARNETVLLQS
ncbi:Hypothetical protein FKW44_016844 [Caligus rogercresseyi]|uniref:Secreted protein n=1 Tax=Caligus rogercresseyi TaxID=217165 RepID=A0A7T8H2A7_CALRO|nr:Hypothetical protein FKW44_016844 [Caligus rogercresseyi]